MSAFLGRRLRLCLSLSAGLLAAGLWIHFEAMPLLSLALATPVYDPSQFRLLTVRTPRLANPTTLQFGPDGALYVGTRSGLVARLNLNATGDAIRVVSEEYVSAIQEIPNHDDAGNRLPGLRTRLVTGIAVTGTASSPVVHVSSSDPRIDRDEIDTNSGVLSRLDRREGVWKRTDLVRGLPRSRYDHAPHGIAIDEKRSILYLSVGGNTNMGAPSRAFRLLPEYPLSAAILSVDLARIGDTTYDLPTLDDPTRAGVADTNDPFGGNSGRNAAQIAGDGPVRIYAHGLRNAYDILLTPSGLFTVDNGANSGFGGPPVQGGAQTATQRKGGRGKLDALYFIPGAGRFFGHSNPSRPDLARKAEVPLHLFRASTNGLSTYLPRPGQWNHRILAVSLDGTLSLVELDANHERVRSRCILLANLSGMPLDVWMRSVAEPMPGSIWIAGFGDSAIHVLVPVALENGGWSASWSQLPRTLLARVLLRGIAMRHDLLDTLREWRGRARLR